MVHPQHSAAPAPPAWRMPSMGHLTLTPTVVHPQHGAPLSMVHPHMHPCPRWISPPQPRHGASPHPGLDEPPSPAPGAVLYPQETGNAEVRFMHLDLASLRSVRAFASAFLREEPHLHLLINNAGVSAGGQTEDGYGLTFQVNHLGHFLLTQLLLERLQRSAPSRVVIVASSAHCSGRLDPAALGRPVRGALQTFQAYCDSKLANVLHARELATRLQGTEVTCYAVHPGFVNTEIFRHAPLWLKPLLVPLAWLFFRDAAEGAETPLYCATQEGLERFSGRYFADCRPQEPWPRGRNDGLARALWEGSERLVGLGPRRPPAPAARGQ
ncbi:dehydrogenase/reductase SDR family member 13 [Apteryx rowi]|uniref:dehydrogenase/reductase SDR family member 13 n=1 Tax=Apteryx rowi TaxID=308060 RepID=UPI000E1CAD73|nr:dehydrogenase/reductase SDR family member 13 [Apteryx rowi]